MSRTFSSCWRERSRNGIRGADEIMQLVNGDLFTSSDGDDLLRQDVQRVPNDARLLDRPLGHAPGDDR